MNHNYDEPRNDNTAPIIEPAPRNSFVLPAVLGAGIIALAGFSIYQNSQTGELRRELLTQQRQMSTMQTSVSTTDTQLQQTLTQLREQMEIAQKQNNTSLTQTQLAAQRRANTLISNMEKRSAESRKALQTEINSELDRVRTSATETTAKLEGVTSEVGTVKTEVASARSDIERTFADLQRTSGDMGVMSGLIATNAKELQALRELGDRNIFEFTLAKSNNLQRVGDIQMRLKKADVKRSRYTVDVLADDKTIEKKDKTSNEPVQFYVASKARQPYELVVNEVSKNTIKGYLSTPKVSVSRK